MFDAICSSTACWDATGSMLQGWAGLAGAGAVVFAAAKAANTFQTYRRQKQEDRRMDSAERVLSRAYAVKRALAEVRSPFQSAAELERARQELAQNGHGENEINENMRLQTAQGILIRLRDRNACWQDAYDAIPTAKALFGDDIETNLIELVRGANRIRGAAHGYAGYNGNNPQQLQTFEEIMWEGLGAEGEGLDAFDTQTNQRIAALELELLPILRTEET